MRRLRVPAAPLRPTGRMTGLATLTAALIAVPAALSACSIATTPLASIGSRRVVQVVAAENFWGSIASQLGGEHAHVVSIITNPNSDPHSYEPTAADARAIAVSRLVVENGIGYDPWVPRLLAADSAGQRVLNVGTLLGVPDGANPHRWYDPANVLAVARALTADYSRLDPADRAYFARRHAQFVGVALHRYRTLIGHIRARYAGTKVGASESIFAMLAPALGLRLITPYSLLRAVSEGTDISSSDKQTADYQIAHHQIKIYVYNSQNITPDVRSQLVAARAAHIPVAVITETLTPPTATFQAWQTRELRGIEFALAAATGTRGIR